MWVCLHRVADPDLADAMATHHAASSHGLRWAVGGPVLEPVGFQCPPHDHLELLIDELSERVTPP